MVSNAMLTEFGAAGKDMIVANIIYLKTRILRGMALQSR